MLFRVFKIGWVKKNLLILLFSLIPLWKSQAQCTSGFSINPASSSICSGNSVIFTNESTGIYNYTWYFGDGDSSGATNPSYTYVNGTGLPVIYNSTLVITCLTDGTKDTTVVPITVNPSTTADFSLSKTELCAITDSLCTTNLTIDTAANQYFWDFGTPPIISAKDTCFTYFANDTFDIELIVVNQYGCESRHSDQVIVKETPNPDFAVLPFAGCVPIDVTFFNTTGTGTSPITDWVWDLGNGDTSYLQTPDPLTYNVVDTFFVSLTATNQTGCVNTTIKPVLVGPEVVVTITAPDTVCPNVYYNLSSTSSQPVSYTQWFVEDGVFQSGNLGSSVNVQWTSGGLKRIISSAVLTGCDSYDTTYVYVNPVYNMTYFYTDSNVVCPGEDVLIGVTPVGFDSYTFLNGNGDTLQHSASNGYQFFNMQNDTSFQVNGLDFNGCEVVGPLETITVLQIPNITLSTGSVMDSFCVAADFIITTSPAGLVDYEFFEDFVSVQSGATNTLAVDSATTESVYHVIVSDGLCFKNSDTIQISLSDSINIPDANCGATTLNTIDFLWDTVPGAGGYLVSIDGGAFGPANGSFIHSLSGLTPGDSFSFVVQAIGMAPCNDITISDTIVCYAINCPLVDFDLVYDATPCEGDTLFLDAINIVSGSDSIGFSWDGGPYSIDSSFFVEPVPGSNLTISVILVDSIADAGGCPPVTKTATITPISLNSIAIAPLDPFCLYDDVEVIATPGFFTSYEFFLGGISMQNSASPSYTIDSVNGSYTLRIEAVDALCPLNPFNTTLTFNPPTSISLQAIPDSTCYNGGITIQANPGGLTNYEFFRDNISVQSSASNQLILDSVTIESDVFVLGLDGICDTESDTIQIILVDSIPRPVVSCGTSTLTSVTFNWNSIPNIDNYQVSIDGGAFGTPSSGSTGTTHTVTGLSPADSAFIVVRAQANSPCSDVTFSDTLTCYTLICPTISFDLIYNDTSWCEGDSLSIVATNFVRQSDSIGISWDGSPFGSDTIYSISSLGPNMVNFPVIMTDSVLSAAGCPDFTQNVSIDPISTTELSALFPDSICEYTDITIEATPNSFINYDFYIDGNLEQSSTSEFYTVMNVSGTYTIRIIATDAKCPLDPFDTTLTIDPLPIVTLVADPAVDTVCEGAFVTLTALPGGLGSYMFYENGVLVQDSMLNIYADSIGNLSNYEFYVIGIDANGCASLASDTIIYTVIPKPVLILDTFTIQDRKCDSMFYDLSVLPDTFDIYHYTVNGSSFDSVSNHLDGHVDSLVTIIVTVESFFGCQTTDSISFIEPPIVPDSVGGTYDISNFGCETTRHTVTLFDGFTPSEYLQMFGGSFSFTPDFPHPDSLVPDSILFQTVIFPTDPLVLMNTDFIRTYSTLTHTDSLGCKKYLPIPDSIVIPKFSNGYDTSHCMFDPYTNLPFSIEISVESEFINGYFEWDNDSLISDTSNPIFTFDPSEEGEYQFNFYQCIGDSGVCCTDQSIAYCIMDCSDWFIPNAISPNGDDKNETWELANFDSKVHIGIYNRWGDLVFEQSDYQNDWAGVNQNGKKLPEGAYYYIIQADGLTNEVVIHERLPEHHHFEEVTFDVAGVVTDTKYYEWKCNLVPYPILKGSIIIER